MSRMLFNRRQIQGMVRRVAKQIIDAYNGQDIVLVVLLKGGVYFGVDLHRALSASKKVGDVFIEFFRINSYGDDRTSREVRVADIEPEVDLQRSIQGKHVIVVDEVADTRKSLAVVMAYLLSRNPASLRICVAVNKSGAVKRPDVPLDFIGFDNVTGFLVGYGLDDQGKRRGDYFIESLD